MSERVSDRLSLTGVSHRFGDRVALDDVSLDVGAGEVVGLVGRNGAGKTTTMRVIMGILRPLAGGVTWHGHQVSPPDRKAFGYMPEERGLYPQMRLLDQLVYLARLHQLDANTALSAARAWITRLGLGGRENDRIVALSHGNQQRAQIAAAMVHDPLLLVLDEPFAGLDPEAVEVLSGVLRDVAHGGTAILFSSHQLELVERVSHRIVILDGGVVRASGNLAELRGRFPQRLRVHVATSTGWTPRIKGVTVLANRPDGVVLKVDPGTDTQAILRDAQAAGPVDRFAFESADLADLFRQLVAP
jgi:ABC-2 type transport system ATP-binding protein